MSDEQIKRVIALQFEPGQVVKLRVPKCSSYCTLSGYYNVDFDSEEDVQ